MFVLSTILCKNNFTKYLNLLYQNLLNILEVNFLEVCWCNTLWYDPLVVHYFYDATWMM